MNTFSIVGEITYVKLDVVIQFITYVHKKRNKRIDNMKKYVINGMYIFR